MRRTLASLGMAVAAALAACGDDGKVGGPGGETDAPREGPPPPDPSAPPRAERRWEARAGDVATWEIRVRDLPTVTTVTWRATRGPGGAVSTAVESRTATPDGRALSETSGAAAPRGPGRPSGATVVSEEPETVTVGARSVATTRRTLRVGGAETTVWVSDDVPFGGIVRAVAPGGVEQTLVSWRRGP